MQKSFAVQDSLQSLCLKHDLQEKQCRDILQAIDFQSFSQLAETGLR
jgi:hypothetical protein